MRLHIASLVLASTCVACGTRAPVSETAAVGGGLPAEWQRHGDDFYVIPATPGAPALMRAYADCRTHIAEVMCVADTVAAPGAQQACDAGPAYVATFQELYDHVPPVLQRMFCSINHLYVLRNFGATAFAGTEYNADGTTHGSVMGIRKSVLDEGLTLSRWATWKEQLSFGGVYDSYTDTPSLPRVVAATPKTGVNDFLYMVVAHEFGHMFDFANKLNRLDCPANTPNPGPGACSFAPESWGALSWRTDTDVLAASQFPYRRGLCFYSCGRELLSAAAVPETYAGLFGSNFISAYASTNPWDDLAETLAYTMLTTQLNTSYMIDTRQGVEYDMMAKLQTPRMATKRQYLADVLARDDLRYP